MDYEDESTAALLADAKCDVKKDPFRGDGVGIRGIMAYTNLVAWKIATVPLWASTASFPCLRCAIGIKHADFSRA